MRLHGYRPVDKFEQLPTRTQQVARAALTRTTKDAAAELGVSPRTVQTTMHRCYAALGIHGKRMDMREQLADHIAAADFRATSAARLGQITDVMLELYQVCARIQAEIETSGCSPILRRRLDLALELAHAQLRELQARPAAGARNVGEAA